MQNVSRRWNEYGLESGDDNSQEGPSVSGIKADRVCLRTCKGNCVWGRGKSWRVVSALEFEMPTAELSRKETELKIEENVLYWSVKLFLIAL